MRDVDDQSPSPQAINSIARRMFIIYLFGSSAFLIFGFFRVRGAILRAEQDFPSQVVGHMFADLLLLLGVLLAIIGAALAFGLPLKFLEWSTKFLLDKLAWAVVLVLVGFVAVILSLHLWPELVQPAR